MPDNKLRHLAMLAQSDKDRLRKLLRERSAQEKEELVSDAQDLANRNTADAASMAVLIVHIQKSNELDTLSEQERERKEAPVRFEAAKPPPVEVLEIIYVKGTRRHNIPEPDRRTKSPHGQTWASKRRK